MSLGKTRFTCDKVFAIRRILHVLLSEVTLLPAILIALTGIVACSNYLPVPRDYLVSVTCMWSCASFVGCYLMWSHYFNRLNIDVRELGVSVKTTNWLFWPVSHDMPFDALHTAYLVPSFTSRCKRFIIVGILILAIALSTYRVGFTIWRMFEWVLQQQADQIFYIVVAVAATIVVVLFTIVKFLIVLYLIRLSLQIGTSHLRFEDARGGAYVIRYATMCFRETDLEVVISHVTSAAKTNEMMGSGNLPAFLQKKQPDNGHDE